MKTISIALGLFLLNVPCGFGAIHYVDLNSTNAVPPYTNWATAAKVIQNAVDVASDGDHVVVADGTYATGDGPQLPQDGALNRVAITNSVTLRSVNGAQATVIDGSRPYAIG